MALVDPNIAMSYRGVEIPNQLAQYGQLAQIQNAQNQNQLAQYQLSSAQRADEQQNNLYAAAKQPGFALDFASALKYGAPGLAAFKAQQEAAASKLTQTKTQGEIDAQRIAAAQKRVDAFSTALAPLVSAVQSKKPITHDDVFGQATRLVAQGLLRQEDLASIPMKAEQLPSFVMNMASSTENSRKALETYLPKALVAGGSVINQNPLAPGGIGNKLADVTMTPFENARVPILQQQANTSAGQLKVAQDRLAQDAQGVTYQVNDQGDIVALPSRLSAGAAPVARPVTGQDGAPVKGAAKSKDISVSEQQASYNIARVLNAADEIGKITKKDPKALAPGVLEAAAKAVGAEGTANTMRSTNRQIVNGAQRDALDALLYLATGAAYNKEQLQGAFEAYIPSYTDDTGTRDAKQARMTNLIQDAKVRAGKAWTPKMDSAMQSLTGSSAPAAAANTPAPSGVDAAIWNVMTPEERKLWAK